MKILYLIFSKLKSLIAEDKFFFTTLFLGVLTCNIMFTYMYGIMAQLNEKDGLADVFIFYSEGEKLSSEQVQQKLDDYSAELEFYSLIDTDNSYIDDSDINLNEFSIRAKENVSSFYTLTGTVENLSEANTVIIPTDMKNIRVGDTITLNGKVFKVVGSSLVSGFIMTKETYEANGFLPDVISVDTASKNIGSVIDRLSNEMKNYMVEDVSTKGLNESTQATLITVIIIYSLCVLAFLYLMISIYDRNAYELNIYEIIGATRGQTKTIIGGVVFVFLALSSLLSQVIHAVFYKSFFAKLNLFGEHIYTITDYFALFLITLFSVYFVVYIYISLRIKKSAIANSNRFIS